MPVSGIIGDTVVVRNAKIAVRSSGGSYGATRNLYGSVTIRIDLRTINAIREGDGKELAAITKTIGASANLEFAANNLQVLADLFGLTYSTSGSTPNQVGQLQFFDQVLPYIGFAAGADDDSGTSNAFHIWIPKMKIVSDTITIVNLQGNNNLAFGNVSVECRVFADDYYVQGQESEVQQLALGSPSGGTFTLSLGGETTTAIAYDADAATIEAALEALNNIGTGNITVASGSDFNITFGGDLANVKMPLLTGDDSSLTDGTIAITRTTAGAEGNDLIMTIFEDEQGTSPVIPPALSA